MITTSVTFDQPTLTLMRELDPVVQRYRAFFALLNWTPFLPVEPPRSRRGAHGHPKTAYLKALLVKVCEGKDSIPKLRAFLLEHPLLILEVGFVPKLDPRMPYGFDIESTLPKERWLRHHQQHLDHRLLQDLLHHTVKDLQTEIPGLGETIAVDVTHIYAWVKQNNLRDYVTDRFNPELQPSGDPDCRLGVKRSTNQEQADGSTKEQKEYLWGYGSGVVSAITADYGDVVLAEFTQPFNENDVTYYRPLSLQTVAVLGFFPTHVAADAAFDAWYIYENYARHGGIAAIPLNQHGHPRYERDGDGVPLCPKGLHMYPTYQFAHTRGYRAQRYRCSLLFPQSTGQICTHEQFAKGKGCVKDINIEPGGLMRISLDRSSPLYRSIYCQRTSTERINSHAKALGLEHPKVRNGHSVENLNTLIYIIINAKALQRARSLNASLLTSIRLLN
jgi:hypothetical protein